MAKHAESPSSGFRGRYGPWALITGAAQGLGAELARQCAARGLDLLLVDVDEAALDDRIAVRPR